MYIDDIKDKTGLYEYEYGTPILVVKQYSIMSFTACYVARSEYIVTGRQETLQRPLIQFWVHPLNLTADDQHSMQLDSRHIPSPSVNDRLSSTFLLPVGVDIAYGVHIMLTCLAILTFFPLGSARSLKTRSSSLSSSAGKTFPFISTDFQQWRWPYEASQSSI